MLVRVLVPFFPATCVLTSLLVQYFLPSSSTEQLEAYEEGQKYKQGKFILEKQRMDKESGWT